VDLYEEWDVTIPSLPPRSRFYRLEPIGIGTPYVESLTSYIARLAAEHCVMPKYLVMEEILPLQGHLATTPQFYFRLNKLWRDAYSLNGISLSARQWVETLQILTSRNDLHFLTMLTWKEVIGAARLLRPSKTWCSFCYEEWRQAHQVIYEPLLWMLNGVDVCPIHHQPLVVRCPGCLEMLLVLSQQSRPGYCHRCACWLGSPNPVQTPDNHTEGFEKQLWRARVVSELISAAPELAVPPLKERIAIMVGLCLDKYARGNFRALARSAKVTQDSLKKYLRGGLPFWDTLLNICSNLSISPLEFVTATPNPSWNTHHFMINHVEPIHRSGRRLSAEELQYVRQVLESLLAEEAGPFPPLNEVARRVGCAAATLQAKFPDLCRAIISRAARKCIDAEALNTMRSILEKELASNERLPLNLVARQLGYDPATVHRYFPEYSQALVKRYRERDNYEQIGQKLEETLANDEEAPSVNEVARLVGYKSNTLRSHFPELCKQITVRHAAVLRRRHEEWLASQGSKIRQAVSLLHKQGVYPSRGKVRQLLEDLYVKHLLRLPEGFELWKIAMKEFGYSVE
jgi:AraC-like DNA-binding protein